jgi:hypothetical protein
MYISTCLRLVHVISCCETFTRLDSLPPHWRLFREMGYDADRELCQRLVGMRCHYRSQGIASNLRQARLKVVTPLCSTGRVVGGAKR